MWNCDAQFETNHAMGQHSTREVEELINEWEYDEEFRASLRQVLKKIREYLDSTVKAEIIFSGNSGHSPTAALNFFLLRSRNDRVDALNRSSGAGKVVEDHDKTQDRHIKKHYEVIQNDYIQDTDPSARLVRYPGHFVPIDITEANFEEAVSLMDRQVEVVVKAQLEIKRRRNDLIELFAEDRRAFRTGRFSLLLLKGGGFDKFYGAVNAAILRRLTEKTHFHVFLGSRRKVSLDHALVRWNFLEERMLELKRQLHLEGDVTAADPELRKLLNQVIYLMQIRDQDTGQWSHSKSIFTQPNEAVC